jgi:hypothetical protein
MAPTCRINPPTQSSRLGFKTHTLVVVFREKSTTRVWTFGWARSQKQGRTAGHIPLRKLERRPESLPLTLPPRGDHPGSRDTPLVFEALPYTKTQARKAVSRSKVWVFDVGLANILSKRTVDQEGSAAFGKAFEHFIVREVQSYLPYKRTEQRLHYWRTFDQHEVDIIVPGSFGCEVKASERVTDKHLQSLRALKKEKLLPQHFVVSREPERRTVDGIEILPWQEFMQEL